MASDPKPVLIGVDSNILIDLAAGREDTVDAIHLIRQRILLTRDEHIRSMDFPRLTFELQRMDVAVPVISTPQEVLGKFLR